MLPASVLAARQWTLSIGATSTAPGARGPLELPRVHPVGAAIGDEAWLAWGDDGTTVQPTRARGLAWIDPADVPGLLVASPSPDSRQALAWRWTTDDAGARVERERIAQGPRASIRARARLASDGRGLSIDGTLLVRSGAAELDSLPIWVDAPGDPLASWRFYGGDGGELRLRPIEGPARAHRDVPADAAARSLPLDLAAGGREGRVVPDEPAVVLARARAAAPHDTRLARAGDHRGRYPRGDEVAPSDRGPGAPLSVDIRAAQAGPGADEASGPGRAMSPRATGSSTRTPTRSRGPAWNSPPSRWCRPRCPGSFARPCSRRPWTRKDVRSIASASWSSSTEPSRSSSTCRIGRNSCGSAATAPRSSRPARAPASRCRRLRPGTRPRSSTIVIDYATDSGPLRDGSGAASRPSAAGPPLPVVHLGGCGARRLAGPRPRRGAGRERPGRPGRLAVRRAGPVETRLALSWASATTRTPPSRSPSSTAASAGRSRKSCPSRSGSAGGTRGPGQS